MLVLTRKHQQQIHVGDNITISILRIKGNSVQVGIHAPREVRVMRGELPSFEKLDAANEGEVEASEPTSLDGQGDDAEPAVSELEWVVMKKLAGKKACLPVRRCLSARRAPVLAANSRPVPSAGGD